MGAARYTEASKQASKQAEQSSALSLCAVQR